MGLFCYFFLLQALRVFVESVLRYGLPVNFHSMILDVSYVPLLQMIVTLDLTYSTKLSQAVRTYRISAC